VALACLLGGHDLGVVHVYLVHSVVELVSTNTYDGYSLEFYPLSCL
jgi:hypothetical protein